MRRVSELLLRASGQLQRLAHGVPRGLITPLVKNDLYYAYESLFDFVAAFALEKRVLLRGTQSPYGAAHVLAKGAAAVTAVPRSRRIAAFGRKAYPGVQFAEREPAEVFDVAAEFDPTPERARELARHGTVLLFVPPDADVAAYEAILRETFRSVRRIRHLPRAPFDFTRPPPATLTAQSFEIAEASAESPLTFILFATNDEKFQAIRLHVGCGRVLLPGWVNMDNTVYPGVDLLWGLERGIPFADLQAIYAEHLIEHLTYEDASLFLRRCRDSLRDDGVLRLTTPNLDWVWQVAYRPQQWSGDEDRLRDCFALNRAFHGWGHHFVYNAQALYVTLRNAGFEEIRFFAYGDSSDPAMRGLEHHQRYDDVPDITHILCVEARGRRSGAKEYADIVTDYETVVHVR